MTYPVGARKISSTLCYQQGGRDPSSPSFLLILLGSQLSILLHLPLYQAVPLISGSAAEDQLFKKEKIKQM